MQAIDSPVLAALTPRDRDLLVEKAVVRRAGRKELIFISGEHGARVHLLQHGLVKLAGRNRDGNETILSLAKPGDLLGEVSMLDGVGEPMDAIAITPCVLMSMEGELFLEVLERNGRAALALAAQIGSRLRWVGDTAIERTSSDVAGRLAGRLLDLGDLLGRDEEGVVAFDVPFPQEDIGRLAGVCRESACKTLVSFRRRGMVDYSGRRLRILRPDMLEKMRCRGRR